MWIGIVNITNYKNEFESRIRKELEDKLDPRLKEFSSWMINDYYPSLYNHYNETYKQIYRTDMPWNQFYAGRVYRKNANDPVSPRALKHVQELEQIKQKEPDMRCILCFVIQRTDVKQFQPSLIDPIYRKAVQKAWINGVEIFTLQVSWTVDGVASFHSSKLPICLFETYGPRKKIL